LLENNEKDFDCINIFIIDDGINISNKNKILELTEKYNCKITFIQPNFDSINILMPHHLNSFTTYSKLFISTILPDNIDKIIYLDCDSLILGSYKELWNLDIDNYYCAGVLDIVSEDIKKLFWYLDVNSYINAGFLLINLKKWREDLIEERFIDFLSKNYGKFYFVDQGVINLVFDGKIKVVEPKYNLMCYFQFLDYDLAKNFSGIENEYYSKEIVDESRKNPVFLHFIRGGLNRPWNNKNHKYNEEYVKYAKLVGCESVIHYIKSPALFAKLSFKSENNKLLKFFLKLIPKNIFLNYEKKKTVDCFKYLEKKANDAVK